MGRSGDPRRRPPSGRVRPDLERTPLHARGLGPSEIQPISVDGRRTGRTARQAAQAVASIDLDAIAADATVQVAAEVPFELTDQLEAVAHRAAEIAVRLLADRIRETLSS